MNTRDFGGTLAVILRELIDGPPAGAYVLNRGDRGMLRSLDELSAGAASAIHAGGSSIAAHVEHVRYGLSLLNRWRADESPWADADWTAAWRATRVSEAEWEALRASFRDEAHRWCTELERPREVDDVDLSIIIGSIAHIAYHLGAIRQMDRSSRGPSAAEDAIATATPASAGVSHSP